MRPSVFPSREMGGYETANIAKPRHGSPRHRNCLPGTVPALLDDRLFISPHDHARDRARLENNASDTASIPDYGWRD